MDFTHLTLLLCICAVSSYPSKPLNDRPSDLAWQAWLLVDSQNNPSETDRRITPKSVFIAPKLGQDNGSLPDCADGYRSDPMGRCIKFVKVDEAAHLDFLLERLNAMYATKSSAEEEAADDEVKPTSGPLQVNIPFGLGFQSAEEPETDPEIAIIVAPTNGNFDVDDSEAKVNVKRTQNESKDEQSDSTMATVEETTVETTTVEVPTTVEAANDELQALFFLLPKSTHVDRTATTADTPSTAEDTTTELDTTNSTPADSGTKVKLDLVSHDAIASLVEPHQVEESPTYVRSPNVRFPQSSEPHRLSSGEIQELFRQYIQQNPEVVALTTSEQYPVRRRPQSEATYTDGDDVRPQYYGPASFNHRNRDRNSEFWRPTQTWTEDNGQKPLVLRFGRYPATAAGGRLNPERATDVHKYLEQQQQEFTSPFGRTRRRGNVR
ncbi:hypothetical protein CBL_09053 [Carabus blaptoides fortunei]